MANRRMFSKTITNSSRFLMMSQSAQALYFHFGMNADDDGFCEHFSIMRMTESKPDDLRVLQAKGFVKVFDDKVLIITEWAENNYIQKDRYSPSKYLEIYKNELKELSEGKECIQDVSKLDTQVRLGKVRIGKDREDMSDKSDAFNQFWKEYPKKEKKKETENLWKQKRLDSKSEEILSFIKAARQTDRWKKGFIKQPPAFLRGEIWNDDLDSYDDQKFEIKKKNIVDDFSK